MKKIILTMTTILSVYANANQFVSAGSGIKRNGQVMTFYSAKVYAESLAYSNTQIINELVDDIAEIKSISTNLSGKLIMSIKPSESRTYVNLKNLDQKTKNRVLAEYQRITGFDTQKMTIFALTDTTTRTTFILPEFYQLSRNEQKAILFHEGIWILKPKSSYNQIVSAEMMFQHYLEHRDDLKNLSQLIEIVGGKIDLLHFTLASDLASNELDFALINEGKQISILVLFGQQFITCQLKCNNYAIEQLRLNVKNHPNSLFLRNLFKLLTSGNLEMGLDLSSVGLVGEVYPLIAISIDDLFAFNELDESSYYPAIYSKTQYGDKKSNFSIDVKFDINQK